jgi:hypothetical protein
VLWSSRCEVRGGSASWARPAHSPGLASCMVRRGRLSAAWRGNLRVTHCVDHEEVQGNKRHDTWSLWASACS